MSRPFEGVSVVEIAGWTFVPAAGAILADLGADVIKVEPPTGDCATCSTRTTAAPTRSWRSPTTASAASPST